MNRQKQLDESTTYLLKNGIETGAVGIILGTGLGDLIEHIKIKKTIDYKAIPHFPESTLDFHKARLIYGTLADRKVIVFEGRFHAYEGLDYFQITYPVRIMHALEVDHLIISNAAGAINLSYQKGEVMLINDHINLQGGSPLAEKNVAQLGERFVDMSEPYATSLIEKATSIAKAKQINLHQGVYAAVLGPQLETKAEYRYLKLIGADAVGMSTVPEVIVANQLKIKCIAFSVLTDRCDPDHLEPINIEDIMASAKKAEQSLIILVKVLISSLKKS